MLSLPVLLTLSAQTAAAQDNLLSRVYHKITRYVAGQQKLPWVRAVERQRARAFPMHTVGLKWNYLPPQPQPPIVGEHSNKLVENLLRWQQNLSRHKLMYNFTLKILVPPQMRTLSDQQAQALTLFLQNGITAGTANPRYVPKAEEFEHYLVRLTLPAGPSQKPLYLIANCYTQELFLSVQPTLPGLSLEPLRKNTLFH